MVKIQQKIHGQQSQAWSDVVCCKKPIGSPSTTWVTAKSMTVVMAVMAWSSVRLKLEARMAKSLVLLYATVNAMSTLYIL